MLTSYSQKLNTYPKRHLSVFQYKVKLSVRENLPSQIAKTAKLAISNGLPCFKTLLAIGIVFLFASGCRHPVSPQDMYDKIRDEARQGKLDAALQDAEAAYAQYQTKNQEWAARFRILKAHLLFSRGSYNDALTILSAELPDSLAHSDVAVQRKMIQGLACTYLQRYSEADAFLSQAEDLGRSIASSFQGDVAQARGILEMDLKDYPKAAEAYRTAAVFARERNLPLYELIALASLGNIAVWQGHYDEAADRFKAALEKSRSLGAVGYESKALGNLGWTYSVVGDSENAEAVLSEAESKSAKASEAVDQIRWLNALADVYLQQHRPTDASLVAEKALTLAKNQEDKRILTECLNELSEIALVRDQLEASEKFNQEALKIEQAGLDQFGITASTIIASRIAAGKKQFAEATAILRKLLADSTIETPLKWQAHARLGAVYAADRQPAKAEKEFQLAIGTFQGARDSVRHDEFRLSFLSGAIEFYEAYVNFLVDQHRPLDALKIADRSRAQALGQGLSSPDSKQSQTASFDPQSTARRLNASLLFYWLGRERSYVWVITPSKISILPLSSASSIEADLKSYRDTFVDPRDPFDSGKALGTKLYESLVLPAEKLIPKNSRIIVLPDRTLNALNFETLIVSNPAPHYWIEDVTISVANSLSLLARARREPPPKTPNLILFGDALFASKDFPVLPDSGKETDILKKYFPDSRRSLFTKAGAKPSAYLTSNPGQFSYLHFATHGTASRLQPLESAIILSPEGDSFKLYARDIIQRPLSAYLVTISACNGAGVKVYAGEGLVGLAWAFLRAGAHNVIGGLWEVSNASTPQLMDELYKGLNNGDDVAVALRNAKLKFLHSQEYYRRPFYWAPFQLYSGS